MSFHPPQRPSSATGDKNSSARRALREAGRTFRNAHPEVDRLVRAPAVYRCFLTERPSSALSARSGSAATPLPHAPTTPHFAAASVTARPASSLGYNRPGSAASLAAIDEDDDDGEDARALDSPPKDATSHSKRPASATSASAIAAGRRPPIGELRGTTDAGRDRAWERSEANYLPRFAKGGRSGRGGGGGGDESEAVSWRGSSTTLRPVASSLESHKAFLAEACERVNNERAVFASYSACCEELLGQVRAAAAASLEIGQQAAAEKAGGHALSREESVASAEFEHPSRLLIVTATMLLFKLSFLNESQGALMRTLLNEILRGVFEKYHAPAECHVGSAFVLKEAHPAAVDVDCSFLLQLPVYFDEIVAARERAEAALRSSAKVRQALLAASATAARFVNRSSQAQLRAHFVAWRKTAVRLRVARESIENIGWHNQRRKRLRTAFLTWRLGIALVREQRMLELSMRNSERLTARSRELSHRIDTREVELNKQRSLKESYVMKADRVEEMLNTMREEVVRVRAKLMDSEARSRGAFEVAAGLVRRLEESHMNRAANGPLHALELDGEVTSRRLGAPPLGQGNPSSRGHRGAAAAAMAAATASMSLSATGSASALAPPSRDPFTHISSVAESRPWRVGSPQGLLVAWINDVLDRIALGPMAHLLPGPAASMRVRQLVPDLCNGKVYVVLFNYLSISPYTVYVQFESEGERRAALVDALREEGIDCALRPEDLAREDELPHLALCTTLFSRYCEMQAAHLCLAANPTGTDGQLLIPGSQNDPAVSGNGGAAEIQTLNELMERAEALLRNLNANKRWADVHQILASTVAGVSVQRCFGVVRGGTTANASLAGFTQVTVTTVRTLRPPAMKFSDDTAEDDARCERLAVAMQSCLGALRGNVIDAFFYYAAYVSTDSLDPYTLDRTAWRKLLSDNRLSSRKRSNQHHELIMDLFDHPGFPILSTMVPTPSPVILNIEDWLVAIVRIFFAKVEVSKTPNATVETMGNLFRTFIVENLCKHIAELKHSEFVAEYGATDLQAKFRLYRDPLKKIYNELTSAPPHRFRLDMFVHLATRLKVPLDPEIEMPHIFASVRIALTDRSTIATSRLDVGNQRGVDFNGFCALVYVLAMAKMGGNPFAQKGAVLEQFLQSCFFLHFVSRVPLLTWHQPNK